MKIQYVAGAIVACAVGFGVIAAVAEEKVIEGTLLQPPAGSLAKDTPKPDPVEVYAGPAVPLTGNWELSPGYAKIEGNILTVEVDEKGLAESKGHAYPSARLPIDLRNYRGGIEISIRARAENVVGANNTYIGFKFQLPYVDRTCGQPFWAEPIGCAGTFDWKTFTFRADLSDKDVESADLTVGLQDATGKAVYDLSTLTARPLRGAFTPISAANRAHRQVYSERVKAWPQLRGVMLPPPEKVMEKDFADLRDWGATLVRFQMGCWNPDEPIWDLAHYPKFIDRMTEKLTRDIIPWARKYGIKVCIDLHDPPGKRYRSGDTVMLYNRAAADLFVESWRTIASRVKGNDDVVYGYDLVNEPKQFLPGVTDYFAIQKRAAEAIRAIDPVTPIVIESNMMDAPEQYPYLPALELTDVIYQIHMYIPGGYTHQGLGSAHSSLRPKYPDPVRGWDRAYLKNALRYVYEFAERHGARIFVGEFSAMCYAEGADKYIEDCISIFNEYGWDWAYHAFREWEGWSVEHTTKDGVKEAKNFIPSPDNPRRRALIRGLKGAPASVAISNGTLRVEVSRETAAFDVTDLRTGRTWRQLPAEGAKVEVLSAEADPDGRGAACRLKVAGVDGEVAMRLALEGAELAVTLDSAATNAVKDSFDFPRPFAATRGERLLLPNGCGYAIPVERADLGTTEFDRAKFWKREMKMSAWGQYGETVAADGSLDGAGAVLGMVETPADVWLDASVRGNGLRQAGLSWGGEDRRFGYARKMRFAFFVKGGPMEMANRVRAEMERRGLAVTFAQKRARHPEMAARYDLLAGAPIVWYWEMDGDKPGVARRLKELGFKNFVFSGVTRRDLNVWITPEEVREIAKVPCVLQTEYDIYSDTMPRAMLDKIDAVRPHWPLDACERDDIIRLEDGSPAGGWQVALKDDPTKTPTVRCSIVCPARMRPYMRERISKRLAEAPGYGARFLDGNGTCVSRCSNPKHPLTHRTGAEACRRMLALPGEEFNLICGTEDGIECYVPDVDYLEGNFSSWAYRVDGGRYMWKIYDETPEIIEKGLDPTMRVPFWEMVFHDCIVSTWYWTDYNNKFPKAWWKHDLLNAVTGTAPMYFFTRPVFEKIQGRLAESVKVTTPVARATFGVRMTGYRWLTADRLVQQGAFANGVRVTVNFGDRPFTMADGFVLPPRGHRFENL